MVISIITAFYKGNKYLNKLLSCIEANSGNLPSNLEVEFVLVNDSPNYKIKYDKSIIKGFKFVIITNKKNVGIQQSRINGINCCSGEYVLILDQDDLLRNDAIKDQYNKIGVNNVIISNGYNQLKHGNYEKIYKNKVHHLLTKFIKVYLYYGNIIESPGQCLIKKSAIPNEWLIKPLKINGADDTLLWIMMLGKKCSFTINKEFLYIHNYTGSNLSLNIEKMAKSSLEATHQIVHFQFLSKHLKSAFIRRNIMKLSFFKENIITKLIMSLKNFDITLFVITIKILCKFTQSKKSNLQIKAEFESIN